MVRALKDIGIARWAGLSLLVALASFVLAGCSALDDQAFGFWDLFWSMIVFFFWFMLIWIFISVLADIFRRRDLSGGWKAIWIIVIFWIPFFGIIFYMIARPKVTAQDVQEMTKAEAAMKAAGGTSQADELAKLAQLKANGTITEPEYEQLKAKVMAGEYDK